MNALKKLSPDAQIILGATLLYVVNSFLDWQQYCPEGGSVCGGRSEWHGIGVLAALFAIAMLIWEINRMLNLAKIPIDEALASVGAAVTLLVLTVLTFLINNELRHWPQWVGLLLSIVILVMALRRGRSEGVEMPKMPASVGSGGGSTTAAPSAPPTAPPPDPGPSAAETDEGGERPPQA